ncbi:MAG: carbon storage regulator [Planctomycetaceae bacterium]|nr:carbon storage regulator [Planctomycetaceae bacterium]
MLVLSRKDGEWIQIGDDIRVLVKGARVSLAIDAPREITIARGELLERERGLRKETRRVME